MTKKVVSLQKQLIKTSLLSSVLTGVLALFLLLIISIYHTMQVQDEIMDEISDMLLIHDVSSMSGAQIEELSEEFQIQYQLNLNQLILTSSEQMPRHLDVNTQQHGYAFLWHDHQLWRRYLQSDDEQELTALVIQPVSLRFIDVFKTTAVYSGFLFVLWCLQWLIVRFFIKKQFQNLERLSRQISEKNAHDLQPIQQENIELQELQPMVEQLNKMLMRVEQALIAEQRFTADAAHELRSPLSAIQMRLQLLKRKYADHATLATDMHQIQQDVHRGVQVLENLLMLARLDPTHAHELPKQNIDVSTLIQEVVSALTIFSEVKHIQWDIVLSPTVIHVNKELFSSCLRNLIDNAIRYQQQHGLIKISVKQQEQPQITEITIEDNGQQLTEEGLQHMGERFYRALGTKTQGSGLGLSICKKIIELHEGKIYFSRSDLGGLRVLVQL